MTTPKDVEEGKSYECDNCGTVLTGEQLKDIVDLFERVEAGGTMPAGECPDCGALCYDAEKKSR